MKKEYSYVNIVNLNSLHSNLTEESIVDYVLDRFEKVKKDPTKNKLVAFHTINKFLLMCHNKEKLGILGNIVTNHKNISFPETLEKYEIHLRDTLFSPPSAKRHINTIMHIFSHFSNEADRTQKELFLDFLEQFRDGKMTIGTTLWEIEPLIRQFNKTYLTGQTYFLLYAEKKHIDSSLLKSLIDLNE